MSARRTATARHAGHGSSAVELGSLVPSSSGDVPHGPHHRDHHSYHPAPSTSGGSISVSSSVVGPSAASPAQATHRERSESLDSTDSGSSRKGHPVGDRKPSVPHHAAPGGGNTAELEEAAANAALEAALAGTGASTNVNLVFWQRSWRVLREAIGAPGRGTRLTWLLMAVNFACQVLAGYVAQDLFYYVGTGTGTSDPGLAGCLKKDNCSTDKYEYYLGRFAWTFVLLVGLVCTFAVTGDILNTLLRRRLNSVLHRELLRGHTLYRLQLANQIDNFDQRVTGDAQALLDGLCCAAFGNTSDYLAYPLLFCLARFSFAFHNILAPPSNTSLTSTASGEVAAAALGMCAITMIAYMLPMNYISQLFFLGQKFEGDFRAQHAKTAANAEQICFYHGEAVEGANAARKYDQVYRLHRKYYAWQGGLMFLRLLCSVAQPSISYMMLSLTGASDVSYASSFLKQNGDVLEYLLYLPAIMARLAFAAGAAHRVGQLMEGIDQMNEFTREQEKAASQRGQSRELEVRVDATTGAVIPVNYIELRNIVASPPLPPPLPSPHVSCRSMCCGAIGCSNSAASAADEDLPSLEPDAPVRGMTGPLFNNVSLRIERGESLVIMGESGCGKSSLLRVIAGLWPVTSGAVVRPSRIGRDGLFFLPQKSYVFPGTLVQQISYPLAAYADSDGDHAGTRAAMHEFLEELDLAHLVKQYGWDAFVDWNGVLSSSERQRLSFVRLYFHRPWFCLADESTSSLDLHSETVAMNKCEELGITLISVAHRPSVVGHHRNILRFDKKSRVWNLAPVAPEHRVRDGHEDEDGPKHAPAPKIPVAAAPAVVPQGLDMLFVKRLLRAIRLIAPEMKSTGALLLAAMTLFMGLYGLSLVLQYEYLKADVIINDIIAGETPAALNISGEYLGINVLSSITQALSAATGALFGILLQRALIGRVHSHYFSTNVLYTLNHGTSKLEGIDGRIVSDANQMREALAWLFGNPFAYLNYRLGLFPLLVSFLICLAYSFSMAWGLTLFFLGSLIGAILVQILSGMYTSKSMNRRQQSEGVLRQHYARVKSSIESITFFQGLDSELQTAETLLDDVYATRMDYAMRAALTVFPSVAMYYWLSNGNYVMATIIQVWSSFPIAPAAMLNVLSFCVVMGKIGMQLVQSVGGFGMLSAYTHRISDVAERAADQHAINRRVAARRFLDDNHLSLAHGAIVAGSGANAQTLVKDLTFTVSRGESVLVMGPSACGKTSLHRLLAGLWDIGGDPRAKLTRPAHVGRDGLFFIPQTNYVTEGSLAEQLLYPHRLSERQMDDGELKDILNEVGLPYLVARWGLHTSGIEWSEVLSGGEAQRLGVARMLYHRPRFACVDEATSALDLALEADCMTACARRNITLLSVATRMTQKKYHQKLLYLDGHGRYALTSLAPDGACSSTASECPSPSDPIGHGGVGGGLGVNTGGLSHASSTSDFHLLAPPSGHIAASSPTGHGIHASPSAVMLLDPWADNDLDDDVIEPLVAPHTGLHHLHHHQQGTHVNMAVPPPHLTALAIAQQQNHHAPSSSSSSSAASSAAPTPRTSM